MVDIIVLNYNDAYTTMKFVKNIIDYNIINKIVVIDNNSSDNSYELLKKECKSQKIIVLKSDINKGYGYGNNIGIRWLYENSECLYVLLANPDTYIKEKVIEELVSFLENHNDHSIVAPCMYDTFNNLQHNTAFRVPNKYEYILSLGFVFNKFCNTFNYKIDTLNSKNIVKQVGAVSGSLFLFEKNKMVKYGMFDENIFLYCEEVVLGLKMQIANQKIALLLNQSFIHEHSVSISKTFNNILDRQKILYKSKLYVLKKYYKVSKIELFIARIIICISMQEMKCYLKIKNRKVSKGM